MGVCGLSNNEISDFAMMLSSGSMVEAMADEFSLTVSQVKTVSQKLTEECKALGSWELVIKNYGGNADATKSSQPSIVTQPKRPKTNESVLRTSIGLRDALFDTLDGLRSGEVDAKDALAICTVSTAICKTVKLEMDAERQRHIGERKTNNIPTLTLGSPDG